MVIVFEQDLQSNSIRLRTKIFRHHSWKENPHNTSFRLRRTTDSHHGNMLKSFSETRRLSQYNYIWACMVTNKAVSICGHILFKIL